LHIFILKESLAINAWTGWPVAQNEPGLTDRYYYSAGGSQNRSTGTGYPGYLVIRGQCGVKGVSGKHSVLWTWGIALGYAAGIATHMWLNASAF
jgi:hypothetical protein